MQIGERIKQARTHRGLTQKELGLRLGFEEKTADVRIAQYESSTRTPKAELRSKIAKILNINDRYLFDSHAYNAEDIIFLLFELDEHQRLELAPKKGKEGSGVNIHIPYALVDEFLAGWQEQKQALTDEKITPADYLEWKLNWPDSAEKPKGKQGTSRKRKEK